MEKIKELFQKLIQNKKLLWSVIGGVCLLAVVIVLIAVLAGGEKPAPSDDPANAGSMNYALTFKTEGGMILSDVEVFVYADSELSDMFAVGKTDANGTYGFEGAVSGTYYAVLKGVPAGYVCDASYPMQEDTQIVLKTKLLDGNDLTGLTLGLGDVMFDFTVTDTEGTTHTLSELLKTQKAVVLNFWFTTCPPCKAEFPFLQEAYSQYCDQIAVLAVNPTGDTEDAIRQFCKDNSMGIPAAKVDAAWAKVLGVEAYPTTVVIDRYGTISLIHVGSIDNTQTFADVFAFYTAETYSQQTVSSIYDLPVTEAEEGSAENPLEFGGITEFEVEVEAGTTVYCDVYKVSGMQLTVSDANVSILYNDKTYAPENGVVIFGVTTPDTYTPAKLAITNTGSAKKTFKVMFSFLPGTMSNPLSLEMGDFAVNVDAGNDQGVYYTYTATESGTVTVKCTGATDGVNYTFTLYNLTSYAYRTLDADGQDDTLTIEVKAGDELRFSAGTLPNAENEYPAGVLSFTASFEKGETTVEPNEEPTEKPTVKPTEVPTEEPTETPTQIPTQGPDEVQILSPSGKFSAPTLKNPTGSWKQQDYYAVSEGTYSAAMQANTMTYFIFTPTRSGVYKISATGSTAVVLGSYGGPAYPLSSSTVDASNGYFEMEVLRNNIGDGETRETTQYVIGVYAADKSAGTCTLTIQWLKEAKLTPDDFPVETIQASSKYLVPCTASGTFVEFDVTNANLSYQEISDGEYRVVCSCGDSTCSINGKQLYIRLNKNCKYFKSSSDTLAVVAEKTGLEVTYSDGDGYRNVEYKTMLEAYVNGNCCNSDGVVPLNAELKEMIVEFGTFQGWWDSTNQNYLFAGQELVTENAWLFVCGWYE